MTQRELAQVRIAARELPEELIEVDAARDQRAEVDAGHAEHGAGPLLRHRGRRAAEDAALTVAVVEDLAGLVRGSKWAADLERGAAREAVRVLQQAGEELEVEDALLEPVDERRESARCPAGS